MTKRTKVLFVLPALHQGGAERVLITLMNGLNKKKYNPALLCVSSQGGLKEIVDPNIPFFSLNTKLSPLTLPSLLKQLLNIKPDIIVSTMAHMNFAVLALQPFLPHTKIIVREAITPSFLLQKYKKTQCVIKWLYQTLYPKADVILSPTLTVFDEFKNDLNMDDRHFQILKNPVNTAHIRSNIKLPSITAARKKTMQFVACGRLSSQKGFDRLVTSLKDFKPPYKWTLQIIGEGEQRPTLEKLIKDHKLDKNIHLSGLIKRPHRHFAAADCFLLPSRHEGLPNVALEALACGCPIIATRESGGISEIATDAPKADITIVDNMDDFIKAMTAVKPNPKNNIAPSSLPKIYNTKAVQKHFEQILSTLS